LEFFAEASNGSKRGVADIALIERNRTHLWLLHSVSPGGMDPSEHQPKYLAQGHWHHFRYHYGEMTRRRWRNSA
jgi:NADH dehydrogenase